MRSVKTMWLNSLRVKVLLAYVAGAALSIVLIVQALIARGIIGGFRSPDILRFGFAPLSTRFVDVWDAGDQIAHVLETGEWRDDRFSVRSIVT